MEHTITWPYYNSKFLYKNIVKKNLPIKSLGSFYINWPGEVKYANYRPTLEIVHLKIKIISSFTHHHVIPKMHFFLPNTKAGILEYAGNQTVWPPLTSTDFHISQKSLFNVPEKTESHTGLGRHEGEWIILIFRLFKRSLYLWFRMICLFTNFSVGAKIHFHTN